MLARADDLALTLTDKAFAQGFDHGVNLFSGMFPHNFA